MRMSYIALCQPGYFNSSHGVEPCQPCPVGYYQFEYGATVCHPHPREERSTLPVYLKPTTSVQQPTIGGGITSEC